MSIVDVFAQFFKPRMRGETFRKWLERNLDNSLFGSTVDIVQTILSLCMVALFAYQNWNGFVETEAEWAKTVEIVTGVVFTMEYLARFYACDARVHFSFSVFSLVDLVTVLPVWIQIIVENIDAFGHSKFSSSTLRPIRVLRALRFLRAYRLLSYTKSASQRQSVVMILTVGSLILCTTGIIQSVEYCSTGDTTNCQNLSFLDAAYLIVITITTLGYGDIKPESTWGRLTVMATITMTALFIPQQISKFSDILNRETAYEKSYDCHKSRPHVLLCGQIDPGGLLFFLRQFFHPDNQHWNEKVVILSPSEPTHELQRILLSEAYEPRVHYLQGSAMLDSDLLRAKANLAKAFFVLVDKFSDDPDQSDTASNLLTISLRQFNKNVPLFAQVFKSDNMRHIDISGANNVTCVEQLKMGLMAMNSEVPGIATFVSNLLCTYNPGQVTVRQENWINQYFYGCSHEIFSLCVPKLMVGLNFKIAALVIYQEFNAVPIALVPRGETELHLFPHDKKLCAGGQIFVIAKHRTEVERIENILYSDIIHYKNMFPADFSFEPKRHSRFITLSAFQKKSLSILPLDGGAGKALSTIESNRSQRSMDPIKSKSSSRRASDHTVSESGESNGLNGDHIGYNIPEKDLDSIQKEGLIDETPEGNSDENRGMQNGEHSSIGAQDKGFETGENNKGDSSPHPMPPPTVRENRSPNVAIIESRQENMRRIKLEPLAVERREVKGAMKDEQQSIENSESGGGGSAIASDSDSASTTASVSATASTAPSVSEALDPTGAKNESQETRGFAESTEMTRNGHEEGKENNEECKICAISDSDKECVHHSSTQYETHENHEHCKVPKSHQQRRRKKSSVPSMDHINENKTAKSPRVSLHTTIGEISPHKVLEYRNSQREAFSASSRHLLHSNKSLNGGSSLFQQGGDLGPYDLAYRLIPANESRSYHQFINNNLPPENLTEHIVLCGIPNSLIDFIAPLRRQNSSKRNEVVIISSSEVSERQYASIALFDEVYYVKGSPSQENTLSKAQVYHSSIVVVLSNSQAKNEESSSEDMFDQNMVDADAITTHRFISEACENNCSPSKKPFVTIELVRISNIKFLTERHEQYNSVTERVWKDDADNDVGFIFVPEFSSGQVFMPNFIDAMMSESYSNSCMSDMVNSLVFGSPVIDSHGNQNESPKRVALMNLPYEFIGKTYEELAVHLLVTKNIMVLGLLRMRGQSAGRFIYTNPRPVTLLNCFDRVYMIANGAIP